MSGDDFDLEAALKSGADSAIESPGGTAKVMVEAGPVAIKAVPLVAAQSKALIAAQKMRIMEFEGHVDELVMRAEAIIVRDTTTNELAVKVGALSAKLAKDIDKRMREIIGPANEFVKEVRNFAKIYIDKCEKVKQQIGTKTANYRAIVETERRKAEEAANKARAEVQTQLDEDAAKAGVTAPRIEPPVVKEEPVVTRTEFGTAYSRKKMVFKVVSEADLPREYLMPNEKAIRDAVNAGVSQIPGVLIYEETTTVIRT